MTNVTNAGWPRQRPQRLAGVLVPLFSVRTRRSWGIGDIADLPELARWIVQEGGQRLVQILPIGSLPGNETSPYSAATSFGIDPMYVAVDRLEDVRDGDRSALLGPDGDATLDYLRGTKSVSKESWSKPASGLSGSVSPLNSPSKALAPSVPR